MEAIEHENTHADEFRQLFSSLSFPLGIPRLLLVAIHLFLPLLFILGPPETEKKTTTVRCNQSIDGL